MDSAKPVVSSSTSSEKVNKTAYEKPLIEVIGQMEDLTGSAGKNTGDGWGYSKQA